MSHKESLTGKEWGDKSPPLRFLSILLSNLIIHTDIMVKSDLKVESRLSGHEGGNFLYF